MIHVIESKISGAKNALEATKQRSKELHSLNKRIDEKIADIPSTYSVRHSFTSSNSSYKNLYTVSILFTFLMLKLFIANWSFEITIGKYLDSKPES